MDRTGLGKLKAALWNSESNALYFGLAGLSLLIIGTLVMWVFVLPLSHRSGLAANDPMVRWSVAALTTIMMGVPPLALLLGVRSVFRHGLRRRVVAGLLLNASWLVVLLALFLTRDYWIGV